MTANTSLGNMLRKNKANLRMSSNRSESCENIVLKKIVRSNEVPPRESESSVTETDKAQYLPEKHSISILIHFYANYLIELNYLKQLFNTLIFLFSASPSSFALASHRSLSK